MLDEDEPTFANWDQDVTALEERYDQQDPARRRPPSWWRPPRRSRRGTTRSRDAPEETWARRGLRDNGSEFTVDSLARYHLHDVLHHSHDVRGTAARATVAAYDGDADDYSDGTWELNDEVRAELDAFAGGGRRRGSGARDRQRRCDAAPRVAVDSSGEPFAALIASGVGVDLAKPNADELAEIVGGDPEAYEADPAWPSPEPDACASSASTPCCSPSAARAPC